MSQDYDDPDLGGTGFEEASGEVKHRMIISAEGQEGTGKSHLACTAPGPLGYIDFDIGSEGVIEKFKKGLEGLDRKDIYISTHRIPMISKAAKHADAETKKKLTQSAAKVAEPIWEKVVNDYCKALERFRTVIVDTGTEMHELIRLARLGKLTEVLPEHYGPVNAEFRDLVRLAYEGDANVIFLHKMKEEWLKGKGEKRANFTGNYIRAGFNGMAYLMQINLKTLWTKEDGFTIEVTKCRQQADLRGEILEDPFNTIPMIAQMVFPGTSAEDWE